jgi:hypothetical protein
MSSERHAAAVDIINRAHHRREPDPLLDLVADDAEYVSYDMDRLGEPRRMTSKDEIRAAWEDVFSRDMTHEVTDVVVGDDAISYMVHCTYPDGKRVVGSTVAYLRDGMIVRIVSHTSWDE